MESWHNPPDDRSDDLQFDHAEHTEDTALRCAQCGEPIVDTYYEVNGRVTCGRCRTEVEAQLNAGRSVSRFTKAAVLGLLAAGAGFGIYYGIAALTGMEFSLIAIIVGVMVGSAVKRGSSGRGGWRYQLLAVFLTYTAIVATYVPFIVKEFRDQATTEAPAADTTKAAQAAAADTAEAQPSAARFALGLVLLVGFFYAVPFLAGFENVLGLIIIAIGLYAAWKTAARTELRVTGPYRVGAATTP